MGVRGMCSSSDQLFQNVFLINTKSRPDRLNYMKERLREQRIHNYEVVDALDGVELRLLNTTLSHSELGCFLTRMMLYREIVRRNLQVVTIFEDDCLFRYTLRSKLSKLDFPTDWEIINLGGIDLESENHRVINDHFYSPGYPTLSHALIFKLSGLKKIVDSIRLPIDKFDHQLGRLKSVNYYSTRSILVEQFYQKLEVNHGAD